MDADGAGDAVSPVLGVVVLIAITVILAAIIAAYLFWLPHLCDPFPPAVVKIEKFHDYDDRSGHALNYDSRILLRNLGAEDLPNRVITAAFYADGVRVPCNLESFHGEDTPGGAIHIGYEKIRGPGCRGETWEVGADVLIDFNSRTFMPGQTVRVDIIDIRSGCVISRDSFRRSAVPER